MDIENLLRLLKEHQVKFLIIGAAAFPLYGYSRSTLDIDIFIEATPENAAATLTALKALGYDVSELTVNELLEKKVLIRQYLLETDIHPFVKGISFKEAWKNRQEGSIGMAQVSFASLEDLIKMKKAARRSKDIEDLKILKKILKGKSKGKKSLQ